VKELPFINQPPVYIEISQGWLKALREKEGLEVALERAPNGQLTPACRESLVASLQKFVQRKNWQPRARALCAIGASGVSLRRMSLPSSAKDDVSKLLRLQIEAEFPLSPEELAWGYRALGKSNGAPRQDFLVGAVKKDRVEEYASLLLAAGLNPVFTPAAIARSYLCPQPLGSCALLDFGSAQLELISFENGVPVALRVFPAGTNKNGGAESQLQLLAKAVASVGKVYVTGNGATGDVLAELRSKVGIAGERLDGALATGHSAAVLGLKRASEENIGAPLLLFQTTAKPAALGSFKFSQPVPKKLAIAATVLLVVALAVPFAEALLLSGHLSKKITALKTGQDRLQVIDQEYGFLQYLKQTGPPYLDALYLFAKSAPPSTHFDSTSMNRRGDISLRGTMQNAQQVTDFRTKLMDSGFFDRVTVEEQVPTPDRQKVNIRITAQWKTIDKRIGLAIGPTREEIEKAKTNAVAKGNSPGGMPMGMPPGMPDGLPPGVILRRP
jgi:hypothetical protein